MRERNLEIGSSNSVQDPEREDLLDAGREVRKGAIEAGRVMGGDTSDSLPSAMSCTRGKDDQDVEDVKLLEGTSELLCSRLYCGTVARE